MGTLLYSAGRTLSKYLCFGEEWNAFGANCITSIDKHKNIHVRLGTFSSHTGIRPSATCLMPMTGKNVQILGTKFTVCSVSAPPGIAKAVSPDCTLNVQDTFGDFFLAHLAIVQRWELFGCSLEERKILGPNWVPDFWVGHYNLQPKFQLASGYSSILLSYLAPNILGILGVQCSTVATASETSSLESKGILRDIRSWKPDSLYTSDYVTGETLLESHVKTLTLHHTRDRWHQSRLVTNKTVEEWKAVLETLGLIGAGASNDQILELDPRTRMARQYFRSAVIGPFSRLRMATLAQGLTVPLQVNSTLQVSKSMLAQTHRLRGHHRCVPRIR
jgi:hypothetical protein